MADAAAYEAICGWCSTRGVDIVLVGVVPFGAELETLAAGAGHDEDVGVPDGIAARLVRLWGGSTKPWVAVVDAGPLYDPSVGCSRTAACRRSRTADVAVRTLGRWHAAFSGWGRGPGKDRLAGALRPDLGAP